MTVTRASEGVKLVERLRLGEAPEAVDWSLAAAILALKDAAARFSEAARDLVEDRDKYSKSARFVVRAHLVAQLLRQLADAAASMQQRLRAYFEYRTTEEDSEEESRSADQEAKPTEDAAADDEFRPQTEVGAALEAGGIPERIAGPLGNAIEVIRSDCGWLRSALETLLSTRPDEDEVLDFLSELEARFSEELSSFYLGGKKMYVSGALEDAIGKI